MATLNIKSFPDDLYKDLRTLAEQDHRSLSQQVIHLLEKTVQKPKPLSIMELQGLGKDLWNGVDAAAHVKHERDAWD